MLFVTSVLVPLFTVCFSLIWGLILLHFFTEQTSRFALIFLAEDAPQATGESPRLPLTVVNCFFVRSRAQHPAETSPAWSHCIKVSSHVLHLTPLMWLFHPLECKNKPWFTWTVQFYQDPLKQTFRCCWALFKSRGLHMGEDVLKKDRDVTLSQLLWFGNI